MNIWRELEQWPQGQENELPEAVRRWVNANADKTWVKKVETFLNAVKTAAVHRGDQVREARVNFYCLRELHLPVLMPIAQALSKCEWAKHIKIGFSSTLHKPGHEGFPEEGLKTETIKKLKDEGWEYWGCLKPDSPYDVVVIADACCDRIEGWGPTVCVGHGTISKNIYFIDSPLARRESFHTALCVPGPWYVNSFKGAVKTNIIPTGFPKMDDLALDYTVLKEEVFNKSNFSHSKKTILYAPTYNLELTSLALLAEEWGRMDRSKYQVLVKLHGATDSQLVNLYKKLCALMPGFMYYVDDQNLAPYLTMSDILISDVSSAYVEGLAFNIPVIVVDNPQMYSFSGYNPEAVEFKVRDAAYRIKSGSEIHKTLHQIESNDLLKNKRREIAKVLFNKIDGRNSYRVCDVIQKVISKELQKEPTKKMNIIIPSHANYHGVIDNLKKILYPANIFVEDPLALNHIANARPIAEFNQSDRVVFLTGDHQFSLHWDEIYDLCLYHNPQVKVLGALFDEGDLCSSQDYVSVLNKRVNGDYELRRWFLKYSQFSFCVNSHQICLDGLIINEPLRQIEVQEYLLKGAGLKSVFAGHLCIGQLGQQNREITNSLIQDQALSMGRIS